MVKNFLATLLLTITLTVASVNAASIVSAQPQAPQDGMYNQVPGSDNTGGQVGGTTDEGTGFDWRWLLPLLAIPLLFLFLRDDKRDERTEYRDQRFAGAKGGQARRIREEDEEVL